MNPPRFWTGIGSRDTPADILELMSRIGTYMAERGFSLRSGGASGADLAFERGVIASTQPKLMDIYLPWRTFGFQEGHASCYHAVTEWDNWPKAELLAETVHPAWYRLSPSVRKLHGRNAYQILGHGLDTPSSIVFFYAKPRKGRKVKGGTNTGVMLALEHQIPVANLYYPATRNLMETVIS